MAIPKSLIFLLVTTIEAFWAKSYLNSQYPVFLLVVILLPVNVLLYLTWLVEIRGRFLTPLRHVPSPQSGAYPLLGYELDLITQPRGNAYLQYMTSTPNNGLIYLRGFRDKGTLLVTSPKSLAEVLVTKTYDFVRGPKERNLLRKAVGDGLIVVEGDVHKFQRKRLQPSFSFRHIQQLYPTFWAKSNSLTEVLEQQIAENNGGSGKHEKPMGNINIGSWAPKVTLDIIGIAGLGRDFNTLRNSDDELGRIYEQLTATTTERTIFVGLTVMLPKWLLAAIPWRIKQRTEFLERRLRQICRDFVRDKRMQKQSTEKAFDILAQLIQLDEFSDDDLVNQALTFLAAGHDTTSSAFSWLVYLLATHPSIQGRLREEIQSNIPYKAFTSSSNPQVDLVSTLDALPLLNAVCNETFRLYPAVPITSRVTSNDTFILDTQVPKGTRIVLSPWAINRSREHWGEDAEKFVPERWIDPTSGKATNSGGATSNYSNMTFLHGPRSCIGQGFARAELKALVVAFVGKFEFELAKDGKEVKVGGVITQKPVHGVDLQLKIVDEW